MARARITMGRSLGKTDDQMYQEAQNLELVLRAGALPAPVTVGEIRQVGASLGDELIRKGSLAAIVGLALVVVFMAVYYRKSGLIADVALILNGLLILAGLALFNATLTLPGIAGFVLTLGIAVDANVLINERVREELGGGQERSRRGGPGLRPGVLDHLRRPRHHADRRLHPALHRDRSGARLRHLADHRAHRLAVHLDRRDPGDHHLLRPRAQRPDGLGLTMQIIKHKTNIDFIGKRKPALFISSVLNLAILVGIAIFGFNFGVDFAGGTVVELKFDHPVRADEVRARAEAAGLHDVSVQGIGSASENSYLLRLGGVTQLTAESAVTGSRPWRRWAASATSTPTSQNGLINFRVGAEDGPRARQGGGRRRPAPG